MRLAPTLIVDKSQLEFVAERRKFILSRPVKYHNYGGHPPPLKNHVPSTRSSLILNPGPAGTLL